MSIPHITACVFHLHLPWCPLYHMIISKHVEIIIIIVIYTSCMLVFTVIVTSIKLFHILGIEYCVFSLCLALSLA